MFEPLKKQWVLFCYALSFFSRVPIPKSIIFNAFPFYLGNVYLPLIGLLYALISFTVYFIAQTVFDPTISIIFMLAAGLLFTGAFHEDGLADICDGFGGGYDKTQRLKIMKDSQIGTYGAIGLILLFSLKIAVLASLALQEPLMFLGFLICAAVLSRFSTLCLMQYSEYAREDSSSKSTKSSHRLPLTYLIFASIFSLLTIIWMPLFWMPLIIAIIVASTLFFRIYFYRLIGGYTGDCLGFLQQVNELLILLAFLAMIK